MTSTILYSRISQRVNGKADRVDKTRIQSCRKFPVYSVPPYIPESMNSIRNQRDLIDDVGQSPPEQLPSLSISTASLESSYLKIEGEVEPRQRTPSLVSISSDETASSIDSDKSGLFKDCFEESYQVSATTDFHDISLPNISAPLISKQSRSYCYPCAIPLERGPERNNYDDYRIKLQQTVEIKKKPQNFRDDPQKRARVKTELCQNFMTGKSCKYGRKCNYAHGHHELKLTKLKERHEAGLLDAATYRTRPCFDHIATGSW